MTVVVVESPAKAKTINKYLGSDYLVLASVGHVRDLARKNGAVDPSKDFAMDWEISNEKQKNIKAISDALSGRDRLILATDPDREGEAISWHLLEVLIKRRSLKKSTKVERVVFYAITKTAITEALKTPREINMPLVQAYLARRALDHLVGFHLSPVLWKKCPGGTKGSAGRVQSPTLRLIVEREMSIESFAPQEYWSISTSFSTGTGQTFDARLVELDNKKIDKMSITNKSESDKAKSVIETSQFRVHSVTSSPKQRQPSAPFRTSTLQQEASRKLSLGAKHSMSIAQKLYETGLITYMRTDGINMAPEAISSTRSVIKNLFGEGYIPSKPRIYKNASKNAQEAHECIRPTNFSNFPDKLVELDETQRKLYQLIWNRTISSQMSNANFEATAVEIKSFENKIGLRATGQVLLFDGFLKVYDEGKDDDKDKEEDYILPKMNEKEDLNLVAVATKQHFTQPPPRYTEATLVKKMEELGIGRPSTYAATVSTIQDREYVRKDKNRLIPEDKGRLVTTFLRSYFNKYIEYDYTADLEKKLDKVSAGEADWKNILTDFWQELSKTISATDDLSFTEALEKLNDFLAPHIFPSKEDGSDARLCQICLNGKLSIRTSRNGSAFIGCSNYPECKYTRALSGGEEAGSLQSPGGTVLGQNDKNETVSLRKGRFGPYLQLGENPTEKENFTPKRTSIPKGMDLGTIDLLKALKLLALPRLVGNHPQDGLPVEAAIGRYGPYLKHGNAFVNLSDPEEVLTIGMNRAVEVISEKTEKGKKFSAARILHKLGAHPENGEISVMSGKYGPYVRWNKINATIPKNISPDHVTIEIALKLLEAKKSKLSSKKTSKKRN